MLSPAFDLPITLLPPLAPSTLSSTSTSNPTAPIRAYPRSPCTPRACATPRARLSALISTSPYFSPSNPFSARPVPGALSAKYTIINTISSPEPPHPSGLGTPSFRPDARVGSRTLRQRGTGTPSRPLGLGGALVISESGVKGNNGAGAKAVGRRMVGMAGWVMLGMMASLAVLCVRAALEGSGGAAGGVGTVHIAWDTQARAVDDVWAISEMTEKVAGEWADVPLKGIWA